MLIAFKHAYFGWNFHGNQYQPTLRTVSGEIFKALRKMGIDPKESKYKIAGRTDAGVSALGNVFSLNLKEFDEWFLIVLNENLPDDITVWGYRGVDEDFNPRRRAKSRVYVYAMPDLGYDIEKMRKAAKKLVGEHDFSSFAKACEPCIREIYRSEIYKKNGLIFYEVEGNAFAWNMVRKIVTALKIVGKTGDESLIDRLLGGEKIPLTPAPPFGLILKDVRYDFEFKIEKKSYGLLKKRVEENFVKFSQLYGILYSLRSLLPSP